MLPNSKHHTKSQSSFEELSTARSHEPRQLRVSIELEGECPEGAWSLTVLLLKKRVLEIPWRHLETLCAVWDQDAGSPIIISALANEPLVVLLRMDHTGRSYSEEDPYKDADFAAAGTLDLLPLLLGEDFISARVHLVYIGSGEKLKCSVRVCIEPSCPFPVQTAMRITLLRAACLPIGKVEMSYVAAISTSNLEQPFLNVDFGHSSNVGPAKPIWASLLSLKKAASSDYMSTNDDILVHSELMDSDYRRCNQTEWNAFRRILVNSDCLQSRLFYPFVMEVAGLTKTAKTETRGHYMATFDLRVLLQPDEYCVIVRVPLRKYDASSLPEEISPMLELPAPNLYNIPAPVTVVEMETIFDENNHISYIEICFEVTSSLVSMPSMVQMYQTIGKTPQGDIKVVDEFILAPSKPKPPIDVHVLKYESSAFVLNSELEASMIREQTIENRRKPAVAAHQVLKRTKDLLKGFYFDNCTDLNFMDLVNKQHLAARRAVISSLEPQPPPPIVPSAIAATRSRWTGSIRLSEYSLHKSLEADSNNPRPLLTLALRELEKFNSRGALETLERALDKQINNRYLLWFLGALQSEQLEKGDERAVAAFRLTIASNAGDGTRRVIGWAALHAHYHRTGDIPAAFIAARNMRKASELPSNWCALLDEWRNFSGEEEHQWDPATVSPDQPLIIAAAMFLCLRVYTFSERLLTCSDAGCGEIGSRRDRNDLLRRADVSYLRSALLLLQGSAKLALMRVDQAISKHGPSVQRARLRLACIAQRPQWDEECEAALEEAERFGSPPEPAFLLRSALFVKDARLGLQRAARAYRAAPSALSALAMGRLKWRLGRERSAERWAAAAVSLEAREADGWAELARQNLAQRRPREARAALRTAFQVGPITAEMLEEIKNTSIDVGYAGLPELMAEEICICKPCFS